MFVEPACLEKSLILSDEHVDGGLMMWDCFTAIRPKHLAVIQCVYMHKEKNKDYFNLILTFEMHIYIP